MKNIITILVMSLLILSACHPNRDTAMREGRMSSKHGKDNCCVRPTGELVCKLTTPEMDARKATILTSLRKQILDKEELTNGYSFKFVGTDSMINELTEFAKTERHCCDFFTFNLSISGDTSAVWFEITGPLEAKEFIRTELEL